MLKRITLAALAILTIQVFGIDTYETQISPTTTSQDQLNHIKAQMLVLKRAFKSELLRIKIAKKASFTAYQKFASIFDKIIASDAFTTKLNAAVSSQFDAIANNNMGFNSVKTEFNIGDFFPNLTINNTPIGEYEKTLFSAMTNKAYYFELGKRLGQKMEELKMIDTSVPMNA